MKKQPINMFLEQVVKREGIPFEVTKSSKNLLEALAEVEEMKKYPDRYQSYDNREDLKKALFD